MCSDVQRQCTLSVLLTHVSCSHTCVFTGKYCTYAHTYRRLMEGFLSLSFTYFFPLFSSYLCLFHTLFFYPAHSMKWLCEFYSVFYSPSLTSLSRVIVMLLCCDAVPWRILVLERRRVDKNTSGERKKGKERQI